MSRFFKTLKCSCLITYILSACALEASWSQSSLVSSKSSQLSIDIDGRGNAMAVWDGSFGTTANNVFYNYIRKGSDWHASLLLSNAEERAIMSPPQVAIDENSNVVIVWEEFDYKNRVTQVNARTLTASGEWSSIVELSRSVGAGRYPQVAIKSGNVVVAWQNWDQGDSPRTIQAATFQFGGNWSGTVDIGVGERVQVGIDKAGNATAVWDDVTSDRSILKSSCLSKGGSWTAPIALSSNLYSSRYSLAVNDSGYAVVIWEEVNYDEKHLLHSLRAVSKLSNDAWSTPQDIIIPDTMVDISSLKVVVDANNNATAVWKLGVYDATMSFPMIVDNYIQAVRLPYKGKWLKTKKISSQNFNIGIGGSSDIGIDAQGNALAVWSTQEGIIQAALRPVEGPWATPTNVISETGNVHPRVVLDSLDYGIVVWEAGFGGIQSAIWTP